MKTNEKTDEGMNNLIRKAIVRANFPKLPYEEKQSIKSRIVTFRVFQALFYGIFALGISLMLGDLGKASDLPFSSFAIVTSIFGLVGALLSGHFAKTSVNW